MQFAVAEYVITYRGVTDVPIAERRTTVRVVGTGGEILDVVFTNHLNYGVNDVGPNHKAIRLPSDDLPGMVAALVEGIKSSSGVTINLDEAGSVGTVTVWGGPVQA